ncbi:uncharacterized protein LOC125651876 [Ostrea edulis]|uniref:uncharacterized protein LOC125651876 n=1 Tax=Ostrea edulis TaxID=37623 RepID=UPI0020963F94|nr:uncharacterized protein LOC125651876 [Ostrea edulis]
MGYLIIFVLFHLAVIVIADNAVVEFHIERNHDKKPCTYFESNRVAVAVEGLINCTWYAPKACCKRTEVTSVFADMPPLYGASKDCTNHMNYMMCYFCAPDQVHWYHKEENKKVHVCIDFCKSLYHHCQGAIHDGKRIGDVYQNGSSFCEGQSFHVIDGKQNCFKFDPTVFDNANKVSSIMFWILMLNLFSQRFL